MSPVFVEAVVRILDGPVPMLATIAAYRPDLGVFRSLEPAEQGSR